METPELSIVVPAYNEAENLESTLLHIAQVLRAASLSYEIIAVDNGSHDGTHDVIRRAAAKEPSIRDLHLEQNQGKGGGILEGLALAKGKTFGWVDADGQADPKDIVRLNACIREGAAFASSVRKVREGGRWRRFQSVVYNGLFRLLFRVRVRDVNAPPKLITREAFLAIRPQHRDWFLDAECIIKIARAGLPITEVETVFQARQSGVSKIRLLTSVEFLVNMLLYRFHIK